MMLGLSLSTSSTAVLNGGGGVVPPTPYLGPVTNGRTRIADQVHATNKQSMNRTYHYLTEDVTELRLVYYNGYLNGTTEAGSGGTAQVTASILPNDLSTRAQVLFGGSPTGNMAASDILVSDAIPFVGADGDKIFVDNWWASVANLVYTNMCDTTNGEMTTIGPTVTDTTMETWTGGGGTSVRPIAILGMTTKGTVLIWGDSRSVATTGNIAQIVNGVRTGEIMPGLPGVGAIHLGRFGDRMNGIVASNAKRASLLQYVTNVIIQPGINDVTFPRTLAQMQADTATIAALGGGGKRVWLTTKPPKTTSTNAWRAAVDQTVTAQEQVRADYNAWALTVPTGYAGCFDVALPVEDQANLGKWVTNGTANYMTADGTHESVAGYNLIDTANVVTPAGILAYP